MTAILTLATVHGPHIDVWSRLWILNRSLLTMPGRLEL